MFLDVRYLFLKTTELFNAQNVLKTVRGVKVFIMVKKKKKVLIGPKILAMCIYRGQVNKKDYTCTPREEITNENVCKNEGTNS